MSNAPAPGARVLVGSTAVGKTSVSLVLARTLGAEIISVDSRQVYQGMEIGSAAPTEAERLAVPHHLVATQDPLHPLTAGQYGRLVRDHITAIHARGAEVLLVGGSGMYLRAALGGFDDSLPSDPELRAQLNARLERDGPEALHAELAERDPQRATQLAPRDGVRVVRALELLALSDRPPSELRTRGREAEGGAHIVALIRDKEDLEQRIRVRIEQMIEAGLEAEVRRLLAAGVSADSTVMRSVGYAETLRYLEGDLDARAWREAMVINTRRYGKRQRTWFRGLPGAEWVFIHAGESAETVAARCLPVLSPGGS